MDCRAGRRGFAGQLCFVNADCANIAYRNPDYRRYLDRAELVLADGIGMKLAGKLLGSEIRQNVNGTDLFPRLCESLSGTGAGIFLLGARPGVAEKVATGLSSIILAQWSAAIVTATFPPRRSPRWYRRSRAPGAAVLLVAFGAPRQDMWIHRNLAATGVKVAMGVGGLFDFYSGRIPRAPHVDAGGRRRVALPLLSGAAPHVAAVFRGQRGVSVARGARAEIVAGSQR